MGPLARSSTEGTCDGLLSGWKTMVGVQQWRNDPDRPFRNIRRNKHGSRSKKVRPLDGSKLNSAGPMPRRRRAHLPGSWPTHNPIHSLHQRGEIASASRHNRSPERCHGAGDDLRRGSPGSDRHLVAKAHE
jgi:hypothetical protein